MSLQDVVKQTLIRYSSSDFKPTNKNVECVSNLCVLFIRLLQEEVEREQRELNQLSVLNNKRARKTIDNFVYKKVVENIFKGGLGHFQ